MSTPIDNPAVSGNWTYSRQFAWIYDAHSCGRIPSDFNETYVCVGTAEAQLPSPYGVQVSTYGALDVFAPCCNVTDQSKVYRGECDLIWCYTSDEQQALNWPTCINNQLKAYAQEVNKTDMTEAAQLALPNSTFGKCEVIDYDRLKGGLKKDAATSTTGGVWRPFLGSLFVLAALQIL